MNWKEYFKENLYRNEKTISRLIEIDNEENYTNYSLDFILKLLDKEINIDTSKYDTIIMEGNFFTLINIIDKCIDKNITIKVVTMDDYALNSYIKTKYENYCKDCEIDKNINIDINEVFKVNSSNILSIGCKAFINDMKKIYNSDTLEFEL